MNEIIADLNDQQREAVCHGDGPLLVLAGAGSGKTRVITRRIAWLIDARGVPDWGILAITFTNKAAREMRERVEGLLPGRRLWVATFHSTCARILRRDGERLGYSPDYAILDTYDRSQLLKAVIKDRDLDLKTYVPAAIAEEISHRKNRGERPLPPDEREGLGYSERIHEEIYAEYERRRRLQDSMDFDDLLLEVVQLLEEHEDVAASYSGRFHHVLVDEYQDTNSIQLRLLRALCSTHGNVCVVGDPDQSIYSWRGADVGHIMQFERDFPGARIVRLEQNYRSSGNVLKAATELIQHNQERYEKRLWTQADAGAPVRVLEANSDFDEAHEVARLVRRLVLDGVPPSEIAIFYRINALQRTLEKTLFDEGIPYQVVGGLEFYQRKEIKDLVAYLWVLVNPSADTALERIIGVPPRKIGAKTVELLRRAAMERERCMTELMSAPELVDGLKPAARKNLLKFSKLLGELRAELDRPAHEVLRLVIERTGYDEYISGLGDASEVDRAENVEELVGHALEYDRASGEGVRGFLQEVALLSDVDRWEGAVEKITLMTLHAAKGLEFDAVVIIACEEGILPHKRSETTSALEEERRLLHVGMTRARQRLFLSRAFERYRWGDYEMARASRFLREFTHARGFEDSGDEEELCFGEGPAGRGEPEFELVDVPRGCEFNLNELVVHDHFGRGRILEFRGREPHTRVIVDFDTAGEKQLLLQYSGLKRLEANA